MSVSTVRIIANVNDNEKDGQIDSFYSKASAANRRFFRNDANQAEFYPVVPVDSGSSLYWLPATVSAGSLFLGIADPDKYASGGTFSLSYNGNLSGLTGLAYDISAAALEALINANPAVIAAGDTVKVAKLAPGIFQISWQHVGARFVFAADATNLLPESGGFVGRATVGDAGKKDVQIVFLTQRPYVYVDSWTPTPDLSADITPIKVGSGIAKAAFRISIAPLPYAGTFTIKDSAPMAFDGTQADWQAALGSDWTVVKIGTAQLSIERSAVGAYDLEEEDINITGLSAYTGFVGTLRFNASALIQRFAVETGDSFTTTLQIRANDGDNSDTLLYVPVTLTKDVLTQAAMAPANFEGGYYTKTQTDALLVSSWNDHLKMNTVFGVSQGVFNESKTFGAMTSNTWYRIASGSVQLGAGSLTIFDEASGARSAYVIDYTCLDYGDVSINVRSAAGFTFITNVRITKDSPGQGHIDVKTSISYTPALSVSHSCVGAMRLLASPVSGAVATSPTTQSVSTLVQTLRGLAVLGDSTFTGNFTGNGTHSVIPNQTAPDGPSVMNRDLCDARYHRWSGVPASASAAGVAGQIAYDATYFYICVATNTWRRLAHSTW